VLRHIDHGARGAGRVRGSDEVVAVEVGPRSATKSSPRSSVRVSVTTPQ
jgi:hypothetical protein